MTGADRSTLEEVGVRIVIDLRSEFERRRHAYEWPGCRIVLAPLVDKRLVASIDTHLKNGTISNEELEDWWQLTRIFQAPEEHRSSIRLVFRELERGGGDAVLFHCQGGKDRTGLIAALVLLALGVNREDILSDFMLSNEIADNENGSEGLAALFESTSPNSLSKGALASLTGVKREWLETLLKGIEDRHGSVERYLTEYIGIGDLGVTRLQEMYLEPVPD
jgi:protein-tyrosine phosphatase